MNDVARISAVSGLVLASVTASTGSPFPPQKHAIPFEITNNTQKAEVKAKRAARIEEIAGWLSEEPSAPGERITNRAAWDELAKDRAYPWMLRKAEDILKQPIPEPTDELYLQCSQNGNRKNYERPFGKRGYNLEILAIVEGIENKGRFFPLMCEYIEAICNERSWVLPAHDQKLHNFNNERVYIDLGSSMRAFVLAIIYDWYRDKLPEGLKQRMYAEVDRRIFQPYLVTARNPTPANKRWMTHWWYTTINNWNSVCNGNVLGIALTMIKDRRLRAEFIAAAEYAAPYAMRGYENDGYCSEGMGYWNYGYSHYMMMGIVARNATGGRVNLLASPKCKTVMRYPYTYRLQGYRAPHFADGGGDSEPIILALGRQIWPDMTSARAESCSRVVPDLQMFAFHGFYDYEKNVTAGENLDELPRQSAFPDAQVYFFRNEKERPNPAFSIAVKGGHNNELHNHNDVGSYVVMLDGVEMSGDPGGEVYTLRTFSKDRYVSKVLNSYGHPVPVVAGQLQGVGKQYCAKILSVESTPEKEVVVIDCTAAYEVKELKSLVRTVTFTRGEEYEITIHDEVEFETPSTFEVPIITYRDSIPGKDARHFSLRKNESSYRLLHVEIEASGAEAEVAEELIKNPGKPSPRRLGIKLAEPVLKGSVTVRYRTK